MRDPDISLAPHTWIIVPCGKPFCPHLFWLRERPVGVISFITFQTHFSGSKRLVTALSLLFIKYSKY